jgi:hypothetical protein
MSVETEVAMAEIRETYVDKRGFGGKMGSRKTLWVALVVSLSLIAMGSLYLLPQFW